MHDDLNEVLYKASDRALNPFTQEEDEREQPPLVQHLHFTRAQDLREFQTV